MRGQIEGEGLVSQPAYSRLHSQLWTRQLQALQRCKPAAAGQAAARQAQAEKRLQDLSEKPAHVAGCPLHPHQMKARLQSPTQGSRRSVCMQSAGERLLGPCSALPCQPAWTQG